MKRVKRAFCVILSLLLFSAGAGKFRTVTYASELTNDSIREKEAEINRAKKEKNELQSGLTDVKAIKKELENAKADLANYVEELDANLTAIQNKINELKEKITEKEEEIAQKTVELEEAVEEQKKQYEAMKTRIKFMYERGETMYVELLLGAGSFGDMLNKAEYIEKLSAYDRKMLDEYVAYTEYVSLCREGLEEEKELLDEAKAAVEEEEASLNELISSKEQEIYQMSSQIQDKESAIRAYEEEIAVQNDTIKTLEAAVAAERKRLAEENARKYDGGIFTWPAPSYTRISDEYGNRMHPTLGVERFHNGIDMAAPGGSAILAAYEIGRASCRERVSWYV